MKMGGLVSEKVSIDHCSTPESGLHNVALNFVEFQNIRHSNNSANAYFIAQLDAFCILCPFGLFMPWLTFWKPTAVQTHWGSDAQRGLTKKDLPEDVFELNIFFLIIFIPKSN